MLTPNLSMWMVLAEGVLSFLSPCVFPLIPAYLSYLAGTSIDEVQQDHSVHKTMIWNALGFVLGLSFVFISLGAGASLVGGFLFQQGEILRKIGAILVIFFGIHHTGLITIPFLNYEKRLHMKGSTPGFFKAFLLGVTFSFGWTPCIGPILGSVLILAGNTQHVLKGMGLLGIYSLGMSIPFIIIALIVGKFLSSFRKIMPYFPIIKAVSGGLLIIMGLLMYFNYFDVLGTLFS